MADGVEHRMAEAERRLGLHDQEIAAIRKELGDLRTAMAVTASDLTTIKGAVQQVLDGQKWLNRTVWGAVAGAVVYFIVQGGLNVP